MTRAESKALESYPISMEEVTKGFNFSVAEDINKWPRSIYQQGYEDAEKDITWHNVKEELPKENIPVLTCIEDEGVPQCIGLCILKKHGKWFDLTDDYCGNANVDYWMYIPELNKK